MNKSKYALAFMLFAALFACKEPAQEGAVQGSEAGPTATVKAVPIREAVLTEPVTAYGSVVPAPGSLFAISLPYDAKVLSVAVSEGEAVEAQERLIEVQGTPDARLALDEARLNEEAAGRAYQQMKVQNELRLADDSALANALKDYETATARRKSLEDRGLSAPRWLVAPAAGLVVQLSAQPGAVVPLGSPLAEVADPKKLAVRLGVEPSAAKAIGPKAVIRLSAVDGQGGSAVEASMLSVAPAVNPSTRLVDLYVSLPNGNPFMLGEYVEAAIITAGMKGLVVPYEAVLPQGGGHVIFTVDKGKATQREVKVLAETDKEVTVQGPGLAAGQSVVTIGAYELEDGMAVRVENGP